MSGNRGGNRQRSGRGGGGGRGRQGHGGGRGRGGRDDRRGGYQGRGRGRKGGGGGGPRGRRDPRAASTSGNQRERIAVESGALVLIDQFMLANPQFNSKLLANIDAEPEAKDQLVRDYGGTVVEVDPGTYRIERDPYAYTIVIHLSESFGDKDTLAERASESQGYVSIDTRCLAMVDRELLDDSVLLEKYQQLWFSGQEKACRDLLRDNGGAVRYGFRRYGDELGVYIVPDENIICLWPDISEQLPADDVEGDESGAAAP